jgi:hypothetical protein
MEKQKEYNYAICWLKSVLHEEKCRTGSHSGLTNSTKILSDVFRHWSGTGKSYFLASFEVGLERVKAYIRSVFTAFSPAILYRP